MLAYYVHTLASDFVIDLHVTYFLKWEFNFSPLWVS